MQAYVLELTYSWSTDILIKLLIKLDGGGYEIVRTDGESGSVAETQWDGVDVV